MDLSVHVYFVADFSNKAFPHNPLKAPTFSEFEELYWKEFKRRQNVMKEDKKAMVMF